ncbi:hypothetical protein [Thermithiobacillus plumbiphilus]|uniref:Outer membrane protein n=1 Tax=Thermithiobacillus plumbiphilus TaxID=1729899 RepID=A0ABU9D759_9PROT
MRVFKIIAGLALIMPALQAQAADLQAILGVEQGEISGTVASGGDPVDLRRDLGLDKSNPVVAGFKIGALGNTFAFRYIPYSFSGDGSVSQNFSFRGLNFAVNDPVHSDVDIKEYAADYRFGFALPGLARVGVGAGVNVFDANFAITRKITGETTTKQITAPIPTLGVSAGLSLPLTGLKLDADVSGMGYSSNRYINADANLSYSPLPLIGIKAGYRYRKLKLDIDDTQADMEIKGPYAAVYAGF